MYSHQLHRTPQFKLLSFLTWGIAASSHGPLSFYPGTSVALSHIVIILQLEYYYFWNVTLLPRRLCWHSIALRDIFTTVSKALHDPLPSPNCLRPHLLPLAPGSCCSSHTGLLTAPRAHQACSSLRAFAPAVPSSPDSLLHFLKAPGLPCLHC